MYAVTTDFLDGDVKDILKFSEGRWEIEECFRVMKTDFETRPVFLHGFGISNMRKAVEKYDGQLMTKCENGKFTLKILILIP